MKTITIFTKEELEILREYFSKPFEEDIIKIVNNELYKITLEDLLKITEKINEPQFKDLLFIKFNNSIKTEILKQEDNIKRDQENIKKSENSIKQKNQILKYLEDSDNIWELISNIYLLK